MEVCDVGSFSEELFRPNSLLQQAASMSLSVSREDDEKHILGLRTKDYATTGRKLWLHITRLFWDGHEVGAPPHVSSVRKKSTSSPLPLSDRLMRIEKAGLLDLLLLFQSLRVNFC